MGAKTIIVHAGNVEMSSMTEKLIALFSESRQFSPAYEKIKTKLMMKRNDRATKHLQHLQVGLEQIVPTLVDAGVVLALENLPSWESLPSEMEMLNLMEDFHCPQIRYWHDIGHGQIRQNLGFISPIRWLERLEPYLAGMHVHDVARPASDHIMPPAGDVDFKIYAPFVKPGLPVVLEPRPGLPAEDIKQAVRLLGELWQEPRLQT
jgi:sugar phosphate isomerase/epimerase